jgi:DNA (cytosine-5)-methyltransferase 1
LRRVHAIDPIPVIDLFAGPGGLGEGFARLTASRGRRPFRSALAIEKDKAAHRTLTLRAFYRQFDPGTVPPAYFDRLRGQLTTDDLFARHPHEAEAARHDA